MTPERLDDRAIGQRTLVDALRELHGAEENVAVLDRPRHRRFGLSDRMRFDVRAADLGAVATVAIAGVVAGVYGRAHQNVSLAWPGHRLRRWSGRFIERVSAPSGGAYARSVLEVVAARLWRSL